MPTKAKFKALVYDDVDKWRELAAAAVEAWRKAEDRKQLPEPLGAVRFAYSEAITPGLLLPVPLDQFRLPVEQIVLRRRPGHVEVDDASGFGGKVRALGSERRAGVIRRRGPVRPISDASATPPSPT